MSNKPNLQNISKLGCFTLLPDFQSLTISGQDVKTFLQAQLTNDLTQLTPGLSQKQAILNRQAQIQTMFALYNCSSNETLAFKLIAPLNSIQQTYTILAKQIFNAKVKLTIDQDSEYLLVQGLNFLDAIAYALNLSLYDTVKLFNHHCGKFVMFDTEISYYKEEYFNDTTIILAIPAKNLAEISDYLSTIFLKFNLIHVNFADWQNLFVEWGYPQFNLDFNHQNNLLETSLDNDYVSSNKGCFPGQEFLTRVKTHNSVARAMFGIILNENLEAKLNYTGAKLIIDNNEIGEITSYIHSSMLNKFVCLTLLNKEYRINDKVIKFTLKSGDYLKEFSGTTTRLPFLKTNASSQANILVNQAVKKYLNTKDVNEINQAINLLTKALYLEPHNEDTYESLAVILDKNDRQDEAIKVIQDLIKINPDSVMAHTNLSIFYMQKGFIELAENEKAISTSLRMTAAVKDMKPTRPDQTETKRRLNMFLEVLAIDSNDPLANIGAGSCFYELEQFTEAIPYLLKNLSLKPNNLDAYFTLSQCYLKTANYRQAEDFIQRGLILANQRNDLAKINSFELLSNEIKNSNV